MVFLSIERYCNNFLTTSQHNFQDYEDLQDLVLWIETPIPSNTDNTAHNHSIPNVYSIVNIICQEESCNISQYGERPFNTIWKPETKNKRQKTRPKTKNQRPRTEDQGPKTKNQGQRTKDKKPNTKDQAPDQRPRTKDQGPRSNNQGAITKDQKPKTKDRSLEKPKTKDRSVEI